MKKSFWLLFLLLLLTVLIVVKIPAAWAVYNLQQAIPGIKTSGVSGTFWQGSVASSHWSQRGETFPLGRLQWSLQPRSLLTLFPCFRISTVKLPQKFSGLVCHSLISGATSASNVDITLPLENISPMLEVDLRGKIEGLVRTATWDGQTVADLDANLLWQQAAMNNGVRWIPLGSLQAKASDNAGVVNAIISSVRGEGPPPIDVDVNANLRELQTRPRISLSGTVSLGNESRSLRPILQFLGDETSANTFILSLDEPL